MALAVGASSTRHDPVTGLHAHAVALLTTAVGLACWLAAAPRTPDLAAQVARSSVVRSVGLTEWWVGWFGGLQLPTYSVLAPVMVALLGSWVTGCIAAVVSVAAMTDLLRHTRRRVAGAATFAIMAVLDVAAGRLTFALGFAVALVALAALRRRQAAVCLLAAGLCCLLSLLAAFFLGMATLAVAVADEQRRRLAGATSAALLACGLAAQLAFPHTGIMPVSLVDALGAAAIGLGVVQLVPVRAVRIGGAAMAVASLAVVLMPGAIGDNVVRLSWLAAAPVLIAMGRPSRAWVALAAAVGSAIWPVVNSVEQLRRSGDTSAAAGFYRPLVTALEHQRAVAGPASLGQRVEIVPTRTHWETSYLTGQFQLARGWDRQADVSDNPLFYRSGPLAPAAYQAWLRDMAVGWVARPRTVLDSAGRAEAALVDRGPAYLRPVWHNADWSLYRVTPSAPLARGAAVVSVQPSSVTIRFARPGSARISLRWTPYLVAQRADDIVGIEDLDAAACLTAAGRFVTVTAETAGTYVISSRFRVPAPRQCP